MERNGVCKSHENSLKLRKTMYYILGVLEAPKDEGI